MKYIKYIIIFIFTIILALLIMFYKPYLGVYKNEINIEFDNIEDGYLWEYYLSNEKLSLVSSNDSSWKFKPNKNGVTELTFFYKDNNSEDYKYKIYYKFRIIGKRIYWLEGYGEGLFSYPNPY